MQSSLVIRTLGVLLLMFSGSLLPPLALSLYYRDGEAWHIAISLLASLTLGLVLWLSARHRHQTLRTRDGFVVVAMLWVIMSLLGALPFMIALHMDLAGAVFESASAFTTTGATVIVGLDRLPPSILFYRQEMQWLGGIGVVVSAIAMLPMLGVGGMQLYRAETPGPMKDDKLTPRIAHTAQVLWKLYLVMTLACALLYWIGGMSLFDAVGHSFATVSTGGFSTHDASIAYFHSPFIEMVCTVFMVLSGISFSVHFLVWQHRSPAVYLRSLESRVFLILVLVTIAVTATLLYLDGARHSLAGALRYASFTVASVITSTGFGIDDFSGWPSMLPVLLIFISFIGGCAGSTAGGMKVVRFIVLGKQVAIELERLVHPSQVMALKLEGRVLPPRVVEGVWGFFGVYVALFALFMLLLMDQGMSQVTAFGAVATCMNNLGPGLGDVAGNFTSATPAAKWLCALAMLLGRLEIFTLFVLLTPNFWRS
jgi:trk/ktr system potassium uptake protein